MVRNGRLRDIEGRGEVADTHGLLGVAEGEHHLETGRVGQRFQDLARLFDLLRACSQRRRAADAALALRQHCDSLHRSSLPDPLTDVNGFVSVPSTLVYASEGPV